MNNSSMNLEADSNSKYQLHPLLIPTSCRHLAYPFPGNKNKLLKYRDSSCGTHRSMINKRFQIILNCREVVVLDSFFRAEFLYNASDCWVVFMADAREQMVLNLNEL